MEKQQNNFSFFNVIYFAFFSVFALYESLFGAKFLSAFIISPLFYSLFVFLIFLVPFILLSIPIVCVHFIKNSVFIKQKTKAAENRKEKFGVKDLINSVVFLLLILLFVFFGLLELVKVGEDLNLFAGGLLIFFLLSFVQIFVFAFPFNEIKKAIGQKKIEVKELKILSEKWIKKVLDFGIIPGFTIFVALLFSSSLFILFVGPKDFFILGPAFSLENWAYVSISHLFTFWILAGLFYKKYTGNQFIISREVAKIFVVLFFISLFSPIVVNKLFFVLVPTEVQLQLLIFSLTYFLLAMLEFRKMKKPVLASNSVQ
ncbi:MAG: hypothetical protein ABIJ74_00735 [archaeon]